MAFGPTTDADGETVRPLFVNGCTPAAATADAADTANAIVAMGMSTRANMLWP